MAVFNGAVFYGGVFFTDGVAPDVVKTGTGGIDPGEGLKRQRAAVKPTGLIDRPRKVIEGRKDVEDRVDESRQLQAEIAGKLAREFSDETQQIAAEQETAAILAAQMDAEISLLLHKKLRTQEEETVLLLLLAAAV